MRVTNSSAIARVPTVASSSSFDPSVDTSTTTVTAASVARFVLEGYRWYGTFLIPACNRSHSRFDGTGAYDDGPPTTSRTRLIYGDGISTTVSTHYHVPRRRRAAATMIRRSHIETVHVSLSAIVGGDGIGGSGGPRSRKCDDDDDDEEDGYEDGRHRCALTPDLPVPPDARYLEIRTDGPIWPERYDQDDIDVDDVGERDDDESSFARVPRFGGERFLEVWEGPTPGSAVRRRETTGARGGDEKDDRNGDGDGDGDGDKDGDDDDDDVVGRSPKRRKGVETPSSPTVPPTPEEARREVRRVTKNRPQRERMAELKRRARDGGTAISASSTATAPTYVARVLTQAKICLSIICEVSLLEKCDYP